MANKFDHQFLEITASARLYHPIHGETRLDIPTVKQLLAEALKGLDKELPNE